MIILPYLVNGGVYKTFDIPQGFGLVHNHNGMGTTTGGGDGADVTKHALIGHTHYNASNGSLNIPNNNMVNGGIWGGDAYLTVPIIANGDITNSANIHPKFGIVKDRTYLQHITTTTGVRDVSSIQLLISYPTHNEDDLVSRYSPDDTNKDAVFEYAVNNPDTPNRVGSKPAVFKQGFVQTEEELTPQYFNDNPNTGAGLQLGYYTLLKMV